MSLPFVVWKLGLGERVAWFEGMIRDGSRLRLPPSRSFANLYHSNVVYESGKLDAMPVGVHVGYKQPPAPDPDETERLASTM